MIIKSKGYRTTVAITNVIRYCVKSHKLLSEQEPFLVTRFIRDGNNIQNVITSFETNENHRIHKRKNTNKIYMEIISFHKDDSDKLSLENLRKLAIHYLKQRAPKAIAVCTLHVDQEHIHLHLCLSGIDFASGKAIRISKDRFTEIKQEMERYQDRELQLTHSRITHGIKHREVLHEHGLPTPDTALNKMQIIKLVPALFAKATSIDSWERLLEPYDIQLYHRGGQIAGVQFGKRKYRLRTLGMVKSHVVDRIEKDLKIEAVQKRMLALEDFENTISPEYKIKRKG